jgi:sigma-B regulation protein RsbU (phosphoserine phosphatase)
MPSYGQSIAEMRIHSAMCAPIYLGEAVEGFLYLDSRGDAGSVNPEAGGFCEAVAQAYGLAVANLKRADLQRRHSRLQVDLDQAREAQQLSMPPCEGDLGFLRYAMRTEPGQFVAGDLFNIIQLPSGAVAFCLGDVAGHGVASALVMSAMQAHLHAQIEVTSDVRAAVGSVNRYLAERSAAGRFASLWVGILEPGGKLSYVDAGHGHWLLQRAGAGPYRFKGRSGIPVGISPDIAYDAEVVQLQRGDRLILYSDGIVEQRSAEGQQFGSERLTAAIGQAAGEKGALVEMIERVFSAVVNHAGAPGFDDDTSAAVIEFRGGAVG